MALLESERHAVVQALKRALRLVPEPARRGHDLKLRARRMALEELPVHTAVHYSGGEDAALAELTRLSTCLALVEEGRTTVAALAPTSRAAVEARWRDHIARHWDMPGQAEQYLEACRTGTS